jgi:lysophospholipase
MPEAAPLHSTPDSPVPDQGAAEWFTGAGGAKLRAAIFRPEGSPRGSVVINTGRTESIEKYYETVGELLDRGFVVLVHDWRGQGLSQRLLPDRLKGHVASFDDFVSDFRTLLAAFETRLPKPWVVLGHSMGGCVTLLALTPDETRFSACVLTSPMLGLKAETQFLGVFRGMARLTTNIGLGGLSVSGADPFWKDFANNKFTHDERRFDRYSRMLAKCPDLALGAATLDWLNSAFSALAELRKRDKAPVPVVILSAADDTIVDNAEQAAAKKRLGAHLITVPGARHEILIEKGPCRVIFWREFDAVAAHL